MLLERGVEVGVGEEVGEQAVAIGADAGGGQFRAGLIEHREFEVPLEVPPELAFLRGRERVLKLDAPFAALEFGGCRADRPNASIPILGTIIPVVGTPTSIGPVRAFH